MINRRMILVSDAGQNAGQHRVITSSGGTTGNINLNPNVTNYVLIGYLYSLKLSGC